MSAFLTLADIEQLPPEELQARALAVGLQEEAAALPPAALARALLIRLGEVAVNYPRDGDIDLGLLIGEVAQLRQELGGLRQWVGRHTKRIDAVAHRALMLSEAAIISGTPHNHRPPLPAEVAELSPMALKFLAVELGLPWTDAYRTQRPELLVWILEHMQWGPWLLQPTWRSNGGRTRPKAEPEFSEPEETEEEE